MIGPALAECCLLRRRRDLTDKKLLWDFGLVNNREERDEQMACNGGE